MSDQDRIRIAFTDPEWQTSVNLIYTNPATTDEDLALYMADVEGCSTAHLSQLRRDHAVVGPNPGAGGAGDYPTNRDMATLQFKTAANETWAMTLVAPKVEIFLADHETVDEFQVDVAALITRMLAIGTTKGGTPLSTFDKGWRWFLNP